MEYQKQLKEFISETFNTISQKRNYINDIKIQYDKTKSFIKIIFGIICIISMILLIIGLQNINYYYIISGMVICIISYCYIQTIKIKNFKKTTKIIKSLYREIFILETKYKEAKKGWLPSKYQIHGEVVTE